jgi:metal-dependent amidase/aminoacylase/carboxypeptidase family protein
MNADEAIIESQLPTLLHLRAELHRYPELSGSEHETARRLRDFVRDSGHTNLVYRPPDCSIAVCADSRTLNPVPQWAEG